MKYLNDLYCLLYCCESEIKLHKRQEKWKKMHFFLWMTIKIFTPLNRMRISLKLVSIFLLKQCQKIKTVPTIILHHTRSFNEIKKRFLQIKELCPVQL